MPRIFQIILLTFFFTVLVFIAKTLFFETTNTEVLAEQFIEEELIFTKNMPQKQVDIIELNNSAKSDKVDEGQRLEKKEKPEDKRKIIEYELSYSYIPENFSDKTKGYKSILDVFIFRSFFLKKISKLDIKFYEDLIDVRGKMKNKSIKLFGVNLMGREEFSSVFVHEFAHYIDLYFLKSGLTRDQSIYFYDISWDSSKVLKNGMKQKDFVSGYAMTNKYEDFAESFTYFLLHNKDFLEKSKKSFILNEKYRFMKNYFFKKGEFENTDFSVDNKVYDYYRDITKIDIDLKNFLEYLKNKI